MKKIILIIGILLGIWISSNAQQTIVDDLSLQLENMLNHFENYFYEGSEIRELYRDLCTNISYFFKKFIFRFYTSRNFHFNNSDIFFNN